jgi:hypothetical protein
MRKKVREYVAKCNTDAQHPRIFYLIVFVFVHFEVVLLRVARQFLLRQFVRDHTSATRPCIKALLANVVVRAFGAFVAITNERRRGPASVACKSIEDNRRRAN